MLGPWGGGSGAEPGGWTDRLTRNPDPCPFLVLLKDVDCFRELHRGGGGLNRKGKAMTIGLDAAYSSAADDEVKSTTCYMCTCRCGIRVHLRNGRVRTIEGKFRPPEESAARCAARALPG
jgi:hypothetical protein